jgi:tetratricopeptide (TPR) repeat protein
MQMNKSSPRQKMVKIHLRCLDCGRKFTQAARCLYYDMGTADRMQRGEKLPFNEFYVPQKVICPHCRSADRYAPTGWQYLRALLAMLRYRVIPAGPNSWLQVAYMGTIDGQVLHPFEVRAHLAEQVEHHPKDVNLRVRYGNTLRSFQQNDEAETQYRAALEIAPRQTEALINLAALLAQRSEREAAVEVLDRLAKVKPKNAVQRDHVEAAKAVLDGRLPLDGLAMDNPMVPVKEK